MIEQILMFVAMVLAFLVLATIFIRRFDSLIVVVLIVTTPFSIFRFMPREILGITGLSAFNVVWLVATWVIIFMILAVRREGVRSARFFTVSVVVFFFAYTHSVIWAMVDIGSYPHEGRNVITRKDLLLEDLFKPMQLVLTGWVIYAYLRMGGSKQVVDLGVLLTAIAWGVVITGYFATGFVGGDLYAGRDAVTLAGGMHANSMGALAVYLLVYALLTRWPGRAWALLRYAAVASALIAIVFTFSRTAFLATLIIMALLFYKLSIRERIAVGLLTVVMMVGFSPLIIERLSFGLDSEEASLDAGNAEVDEAELNRISAGRIDKIWLPLLPEVARNPLFGNGRYTTLKSEAFANKTWGELGINSPHSAYIEVLIDMGLIGFALAALMFWRMYRLGCQHDPRLQYMILALALLSLTAHSFYPYIANYIIWIIYGSTAALAEETARGDRHPEAEVADEELVGMERDV